MYFGSTKNDVMVLLFLLAISLIISVFIWKKRKNLILSIFSFSLLGNWIFYVDRFSPTFNNLDWIVKFTLYYWPWINVALFILLIASYIKNKRKQ